LGNHIAGPTTATGADATATTACDATAWAPIPSARSATATPAAGTGLTIPPDKAGRAAGAAAEPAATAAASHDQSPGRARDD
jgi:hypothetical protein